MAWKDEYFEFKNAGFSDSEIAAEGQRVREEMSANGFSGKEIDGYFGVKEPDMAPVKNIIQENLKRPSEGAENQPKVASSFIDAIQAGFQMSSGAMAIKALNGKSVMPDTLLPEDAPRFYKVASSMATLAGDLPAMIAGTFVGAPAGATAGATVGSAVPVLGTAAGAAAGAVVGAGAAGNALPTAIRETLMQMYEKGEVHTFSDFWDRASAVFLETAKAGVVGGVTAGVGGKVAGTMLSRGAAPAAARIASTSSEIATMVTVGKALEGEMPNADDFTDAAMLVGAMHLSSKAPGKLRQIFAKTGAHPAEVLQEAKTNPVVQQELLNESDAMPKLYSDMAKEQAPIVEPKPTEQTTEPLVSSAAETPPAEPTAVDKILSKVGEQQEKQKPSYSYDDFYKDYVDRLDPVKRAVETLGADASGLTASENPYKLARMANDYKAKVQHFFEKGTLDFKTLEQNGKSFSEIVSPFKDDMSGLKAFLISKRALELEARGIKSGFDSSAASEVVSAGEAKYGKAAKDLTVFQNNSLKYLKDSGVISEKAYNSMITAGQSYVSFKRISDAGDVISTRKGSPVKKIKGSDLDIQDPFISMIDNADLYLQMAERNRATKSLVDLASKNSEQGLLEKVAQPQKAIEVTKSEIAKLFKEKGIDADPEALTVFRRENRELAPNEFEVYREGKREVYRTEPALAEAIKSLDGNGAAQNIVFKIARGITTVKRLGISLTPDFVLRNFFRDQLTAGTFTKGGSIPFYDTVVAMGDIIKKNDSYYNWLKAGGANGAFLELGEKYLNNDVMKLEKETGFMGATWNVIQKPMHMLEMVGSLTEQATRLAEAKKVMDGASSGPNIFDAGFASRESTIDFQRIGAKISAINAITAFSNAQIQGLDRSIRAFKDNPTEVALRAGMYITAPSIMLWWATHDDERVKEIPRWQKDLFWIIPTDNWVEEQIPGEAANLPAHLVRQNSKGRNEINKGVIYRLPKPTELGVLFGSVPERVLETFFADNPDAAKGFGETIQSMVTPAFIPDAVSPIFEQYANKSFFTDGKLVPSHLEGILPQYQYTDYTTDTAKALGKMVMTVPFISDLGPKKTPLSSPMVIENYVRSWSGSLGMYAMQIADKGLQAAGMAEAPVRPTSTLSDIPFVKAFVVRYPSAGTESLQKFSEAFEENKRYQDTVRALMKRGNMEEANALMMDQDNADKLQSLSGVDEAIRNQSAFIQMVNRNPDIKPDEKRQIIDGAYFGMIESAKMGLSAVKDWRKSLEQQKDLLKEKSN